MDTKKGRVLPGLSSMLIIFAVVIYKTPGYAGGYLFGASVFAETFSHAAFFVWQQSFLFLWQFFLFRRIMSYRS